MFEKRTELTSAYGFCDNRYEYYLTPTMRFDAGVKCGLNRNFSARWKMHLLSPHAIRLAMLSSPARNFFNNTFFIIESLRATEGEPYLDIHPEDAAERGIKDGEMLTIHHDHGAFTAKARVTECARLGVVIGLSIYWKKLGSDGRNANEVTSQRLTDMGRGPIFYDVLVEVRKCHAA